MSTGKGQLLELILEDGCRYLRVACPQNLIPAPGQYLLAGDGSDSPLPVSLFYTDSAPQGFIATAQLSNSWNPGLELSLRGPLGRGFTLPSPCSKIGLIAFDASPARLNGLIQPALKREAAVVLVCASAPENLPDDVEVQPMSTLEDVIEWADYVAGDITRENLAQMRERLMQINQHMFGKDAQVLIHTPVPCGGIAECGICAVTLKSGWRLACKDGPVFDWGELA
jgi:dihydroorotate dehydrogenase electron transfer subunit